MNLSKKKIVINSLEEIKSMGDYWKNKFRDHVQNSNFPIDFHNTDDYEKKTIIQEINSDLYNKISNITRNNDLAVYIFMTTILQVELFKYNNVNNIAVGSPVYIKTGEQIDVNSILPLITSLNNDMSFKEALINVKKVVQEAYENQLYPIKEIIKDRDIVDVLPVNCAMKNLHTEKNIEGIINSNENEIAFLIEKKNNSIILEVNYNSNLLLEDTIKRINKHYINIVEKIVDNLDMKISEIELLTDREKNKILYEFNDTEADYPKDKTIQELFEEQVEKTPNNIAVLFEDKKLTYRELNQKANSLARVLREKGIGPDSIVGIMVERSLEMIIGVMGILKAGGAYLPIDPSYPTERIEYMLQDSEADVVIIEGKEVSIQEFDGEIINIKDNDIYNYKKDNLSNINKSDNLAYIIYTSGSTGKPKGVMIEHAAIINRINWMQKKYPLHHDDVILQKTTYTFDVSVWELFWWSLVGAKVCMLEPEKEKDPKFIIETIQKSKVTTIHFVPSMLNAFIDCIENKCELEKIKTLRRIFCSGEAITILQVERLRKLIGKNNDIKLINLYGPTEAAVDVTYFECFDDKYEISVPIGKPIDNTKIYIINKKNELLPIGIAGELCISGAGLARGYLNRSELTSEKFVENPFECGRKMYKTGDLARWLPDGNIEFLDRIDNQVKIRGFRIETGEIENTLIDIPHIKNAVVLAKEDEFGEKYLTGYIETDKSKFETINGKKRYTLPNNMAILSLNKNETDFMYQEIFEEENYIKYGIEINDNDFVFDIGANIGMFSLYADKMAKNVNVFSFEPIPDLFEILDVNTQLYNNNTKAFKCGISDKNTEEVFTFYPKASIMSGKYGDVNVEKEVYSANLSNVVKEEYSEIDGKKYYEELVESRFEVKNITCKLKTLSTIIKENNIERIDLLKVDVEKSELDVLNGIEEQDWIKIKQIVLEVHDIDGQLDKVTSILRKHCYKIEIDTESIFENTGVYIVYASAMTDENNQKTYSDNNTFIKNVQRVDNNIITKENLVNYLTKYLPKYMIPERFVQLEKLPLTSNGKVDRKALLSLEQNISISTEYQAPRTKVEEKLANMWSEVLRVDKVGINDNFFDIGGHSLKATVLVSKIHKEFNSEISLTEFFESPTIKELSEFIQNSGENPYTKIEIIEDREYYEASSAQKRMYMLQQFDKDSVAYNMPIAFELEGELDKERIEETFKKIVIRHESLRVYFETIEGEIVQKIDDLYKFKLEHKKCNEEIEHIINKFVRPFQLEKAPLFRVELVESREKKYLLIDMHHIISDGISMSILIKEFKDIFNGKSLEPLKLQYKDFAAWQNNFLKSEDIKVQEEYWINKFSDEIPILDLPYDYERPAIQSFEGNEVSFELDERTTEELRKLTKETGTTMHMVLLSAFNIALSRYSGQEDIVVGVPIAGRPNAELQNIMGMFVNTLALRNNPQGDKKYLEFLKEVKDNALKSYENQSYQLETLIEKLDVRRDTSRNPLFDVMFTMVDVVEQGNINLEGLTLKEYKNQNKISKFDLTLNAIEDSEILKFTLEYCTKLFKQETIVSFSKHYINVLGEILNNKEIKISEIELLSEEERNKILFDFNDTNVDYPKDKTIQELFEEQVEKTPDDLAVVFQHKKLTYRELNEKSNQLARVLREKGIGEESIVGIMVERSLEMIIGIMGVLKSGGAYLPIDSKYPDERIEYMLSDSNVKLLLTQKSLERNTDISIQKVYLDNLNLLTVETVNLDYINNANSLAYVIYTSGSTGNPKGVLIDHSNVCNLCTWVSNTYELHKNKNVLQNTSISFDVSVEEIIPTLVTGGTLYITTEFEAIDREKFREFINKNNINIVQVVPSTLQAFILDGEKLKSVNVLVSGGEVLSESMKNNILKLGYNLYNTYGPTEATVDITTTKCVENKEVVIGKPVANVKVYITNKYGKLQPIGVPGELCIGGDVLARGYLNKRELTERKFIDNHFESNKKMYKTGDLARWLPDGNIDFLGRIDNQVKIKGVRIELEEIENRLVTYESIKEAVVLAKSNRNNEKYLCAYLVCEEKVDISVVKDYLKESLPGYMVPRYFVNLENMPLTSNGKVNRKALPKPEDEGVATGAGYVPPRNKIEEVLVKIWCEVLNEEKVGINDNFFDLGGHSLKATVLISKIHKELNREIPLKELFKTPTIKGLSDFIQNLTENPYSKIEKVEEKEYYETSSAQKRMYMVQEFEKESVAYNMPIVFEAKGKVDGKRIEETFKKLVERHDALRTYFETVEEEIVQKIDNTYEFKLIEREDIDNIESLIDRFIRPFKLDKVGLFRVELVASRDNTYLLIDMNHIISDGISMSILIKEFIDLYNGKPLEPLNLQYKDFASWQNNFLKSEEMKKQEEYWVNRFNDEVPVLNLPYDYERPSIQSFEGDNVSFKIDEETTEGLRKLTKETETTMHMVLLSAFNILLSKYSGQDDIVVGTPIAGRHHAELQNIMGMFINTLALRNKPEGDKKYIEFLKEVKENALMAYENQSYQLEALVEMLDIRRDTSRNPLFDVMFNMVDAVGEDYIELDGISLREYNNENKISKFDLNLSTLENDKTIELNLEYCTKLFKEETIMRMGTHYIQTLKTICENNEVKLSEIEIITEKEKNQILYEFNDTKISYPKDKTIQELFEEQVEKTPDNIALVFEDKQLTYRELNEKSNQLARVLRSKGIGTESIVAIMVDRSLEMIIGIMGILKSGGAYLPIDPSYPKDRVEYIFNDAAVNTLVISEHLIKNVEFSGETIDIENQSIFSGDNSNLEKINKYSDLAYVIYTSGSTGKPKGVMIEHRSVINYINYCKNNYIENNKGDFPLFTSISFDLTVTSIYTPLLSGNRIRVYSNIDNLDIMHLLEDKLDIMKLTPAHLSILNEANTNTTDISKFIVGGEELTVKLASKILRKFNRKVEIINEYGPTEASVGCIAYKFLELDTKEKTIPIGVPIKNTRVYIMDRSLNIVPIGVPGELCIAGDGLARGYLNRPELTSEKFIENPFEQGKRMYKTGDLARWLPDGNIEFLGRIDSQVKIRGFRIELGEIENRLLQHKDVKEAAVVVKKNDIKEDFICAYVVSKKDIKEINLKGFLNEGLPQYMVPSYFIQLEKMPLTSNGKLDRKTLPEPCFDAALNEYEAPRNEVEEKLVKVWSEVLGNEKLGINDNFFDLGGHSLKATVLISKIYKELNVQIPLKELFKSPTIKEISKYVENSSENVYKTIEKVEEKEYYGTSSAQKRLYTLQQFEIESTAYNMPVVYEIKGKIYKERIENTFKKLVERHDALRTYFQTREDQITQKVDTEYEFKMLFRKTDEEELKNIIKKFIRPFDLEKLPLFRVEIIESKSKNYLLIDMHHIISDGVSMNILLKEFVRIYNGEELEPLRIQYKDFAEWQNKFLKSEEMKKQEEYWMNRFNDEIPVLNMPTDYERPIIQSFEGDNLNFTIDEETTNRLREIAKESGSTMHMVLMSTMYILLSKYSRQEDIVVGTPIVGRPHADLQNIMGMFVNTLALRNKPSGEKSYIEFLKEVKENCLEAYENQSYQFEELIEKVNVRRDTSRNPLFDVMFNMANIDYGSDLELDGLTLKPTISESKAAKFDLTVSAVENGKTIEFTFVYSTKLFKEETIKRMSNHYIQILKTIYENNEVKLSEIEIITEKEKNQILYDFNDTKMDYPKDKTIQELFEEQVEKTPDNIAVVFEDKQLTYRELNEKSNQLARVLRTKGVQADSVVGLMVERSLEMIIGIMGILKSGGAYLPINASYPRERIEYMLKDSESKVLLTEENLVYNIEFDGEIIDLYSEHLFEGDSNNLEKTNSSNHLAYIIYTSGTTGNPKGVMVEHNNVVRLMFNDEMLFDFNDKDVWTMFHSYCFDFSVWEMYGALLYGGKLIIVPELVTKDFEKYLALLKREKVTILNQTPSAFYNLINIESANKENDLRLRYIIFGGEALNPQRLYEWKQKYNESKLINMYGITETTVHVTYKEIGSEEIRRGISNIGTPIPTLTTYVMDENLKIQPIGVPGELCVGGDGVVRGYLNRDELTEKRFVINPYIPDERIYKSGDLVKLLENGELEYLGRIDNQVKIRGFRIELGEIENRLLNHDSIIEAIVLPKDNGDNEKYLCAYVVCEDETDNMELRNYLKESLPEYMIPAYFMNVDKFPLTVNGKINKKALPEPNINELIAAKYEAPRNKIEEKLTEIWCEVLGVEKLGINDNFFDLGGHSLKAIVLMSKIHKELNVELQLKELFKNPTIKEISKYIESSRESLYFAIEKVEEKVYYETSSAQKRLYTFQQFEKESTAYNMPTVYELEGEIDKERIEKTFKKLMERHEVLRTYYETLEGEIIQKIDDEYEFKMMVKREDEKQFGNIIKKFIRPFDLEKAPLFRVEIIENKSKNYLLIDMHHIISDGVSMSILIKEFVSLYNGEELEPLTLQYKDFAEWQNKFLKSEEMKKQEEYWMNRFNDEIPVLNMPTDYERPINKSFEGANISFAIDEEATNGLREIAKETGSTMHMVLLSVFNILLSKYSRQEDIVVGTPIVGRPHADLQNIMGMFVNTLALRNKPNGEKRYEEFLKEVKENSLQAYENQNYQVEELFQKLQVKRDPSRNPLFDVMFSIINIDYDNILELNNLRLKPCNTESKESKFDLNLIAIENENVLEFNLEYCSKLFKKQTIDRIIKDIKLIISIVSENSNIEISKINLVSNEEEEYFIEVNHELDNLRSVGFDF